LSTDKKRCGDGRAIAGAFPVDALLQSDLVVGAERLEIYGAFTPHVDHCGANFNLSYLGADADWACESGEACSGRMRGSQSSSSKLTLLFSKAFRTPAELLQHHFKLLQFFRGDILEGALDDSGVPAKDREEHLPSFFRQRHRPDPPIRTTLFAADQTFLV
jgi:hypothetical protein